MNLYNTAMQFASDVSKALRGEQSGFLLQPGKNQGQPHYFRGNLTPVQLREMALKSDTVASCVDAIVSYCGRATLTLVPKKAGETLPTKGPVTKLQRLLLKPNTNGETLDDVLAKVYRDLAVMDKAAIELVPDMDTGEVAEMYALDAATLEVVSDAHGYITGYNQIGSDGKPIPGRGGSLPTFQPTEVVYFRVNPRSDSSYGWSKLESAYAIALIEQHALHYIAKKFTEGRVPFGILDLGRISKAQLSDAISALKEEQRVQQGDTGLSGSNVLMTGSGEGGMKFIPFGASLRDLEAPALMSELRFRIMSTFGVTENEFGMSADVNRSNGFHLSYTFKNRAVLPILRAVSAKLTQRLCLDEYKLDNLELEYSTLDERDDKVQSEIDNYRLERGIVSINEVRRRLGENPIKGGDTYYVYTSTGAVPVDQLQKMAERQLNPPQQSPQQQGKPGQPGQQGQKPPADKSQPQQGQQAKPQTAKAVEAADS